MTRGTLPVFRTARLILRQRTLDDLEACIAMDRDPEVTRFVRGPWSDPVAHRAFVEERITMMYPEGLGYWSVLSGPDFLGWVLLRHLHREGPEVEIGWRLRRAAWGRGYATEAARPVLEHGLATVKLPQIIAEIDTVNLASLRVAQKLGLRREASFVRDGHRVERYVVRREKEAS
jgi:RimJ/RimL family protein N-acetyltransferase